MPSANVCDILRVPNLACTPMLFHVLLLFWWQRPLLRCTDRPPCLPTLEDSGAKSKMRATDARPVHGLLDRICTRATDARPFRGLLDRKERHAADAVRTSRDKNFLRKMSPRPPQQSNEGKSFQTTHRITVPGILSSIRHAGTSFPKSYR